MIMFESIYLPGGAVEKDVIDFLYGLLAERDETTNISHVTMPTVSAHTQFVLSCPYAEWWLLVVDGERVGACYLTNANEIGLFLLKRHRGKGYGREAIQTLKRRYDRLALHANINPKNARSIAIFEDEGFVHVQNTYRWKRS
jgi:RimJ/RimL family protein N-acetyltransferase